MSNRFLFDHVQALQEKIKQLETELERAERRGYKLCGKYGVEAIYDGERQIPDEDAGIDWRIYEQAKKLEAQHDTH